MSNFNHTEAHQSQTESLLNDAPTEQVNSTASPSPPPILKKSPSINSMSTDSYTTVFEDELIFIDTSNWRYSGLLKAQILSCYGVFLLFGLADQTLGTLIPLLQADYNIGDIAISLVFLSMVSGYFITALLNEFSHKLLGVKGVVILGAITMTFSYLIVSTRPPYIIFVISYLITGIGFGSLDAAMNSWMGNLVDSNQILGILHGFYGIGCMISPPLITYLVEKPINPIEWNQYYILLCLVGCSCVVGLVFSFQYETAKKYKYVNIQKNLNLRHLPVANDGIKLHDFNIEINDEDTDTSSNSEDSSVPLGATLKSRLVWIFATILFLYVGGEVAFGSWMITFLLRIRKLSYKQSSYIATTFWTGLTVGRIILGFVTAHYFNTELEANFVYLILSTGGYLLFYLLSLITKLPSILLFLVAFFIGTFVGPIFPTTIVSAIKILPSKFHTSGIGFICAFGGGGAAGIPFLIGLIAESNEFGLKILPLIVTIIFTILVFVWFALMLKYKRVYGKNVI
ncbi:major facilitator superfamily domain-containing protein [Scheffersomyces amazonensis]|uniref:major facilitator superfamily domain-containing protein n=1 Tax=Scheffersomyces amazonensis TaxID=1078765 RepID=UPI00315D4C54